MFGNDRRGHAPQQQGFGQALGGHDRAESLLDLGPATGV
jgi:hypothetical protein